MMKLTTKSLGPMQDGYAVAWRVGTRRKGILLIEGINNPDPLVAAELTAMQHLLLVAKVFNMALISGKGITLEVSSPQIKKLARGKSSKNHLKQLARFLSISLNGAELLLTNSQDEFLPKQDECEPERISALVDADSTTTPTPALGQIQLTSHAIEQYSERLHSGETGDPAGSLLRRLKHPELKRQPLSPRVVRHKLRKYGTIDNLEIWAHDTSQMHYVVVRDHGSRIGTVVTVYRRHPDYD